MIVIIHSITNAGLDLPLLFLHGLYGRAHRTSGRIDASNVFRVTKRLGWIPDNATYEKAHRLHGALIPAKIYNRLHIILATHRYASASFMVWLDSRRMHIQRRSPHRDNASIRRGPDICIEGVPRSSFSEGTKTSAHG
jgi:hypothetical protein